MIRVLHGDCLSLLPTLDADSLDSCVCDPPYHLTANKKGGSGAASDNPNSPAGRSRITTGFMGKIWDGGDVAFKVETWLAVYRVLKPGAHLIAFGGTRTYHRLVCAIEDAGFEVRDAIMWHYGSGFPKSHNISIAIDKAAGAEREVVATGAPVKRMIPGADQNKDGWIKDNGRDFVPTETAPATDAARQWSGWGTALKPATEIICVARKPLSESTVAANVLRHGTGGINIDACRVETADDLNGGAYSGDLRRRDEYSATDTLPGAVPLSRMNRGVGDYTQPLGRFPANVVHDGSEEVLAAFPNTGSVGHNPAVRGLGGIGNDGHSGQTGLVEARLDSGSAARFFYTAKADASDRLQSKHPTVKPVDLMRWLIRLVTPPVVFMCETCDKSSHENSAAPARSVPTMREMRDDFSPKGQPETSEVLFSRMCGQGDGSTANPDVRGMSETIQAGSGVEESKILLPIVRQQGEGGKVGKGLFDYSGRVSGTLSTNPSECDEGRLHNGAPGDSRNHASETIAENGSRSSSKWRSPGQSTGEFGSHAENQARHGSETSSEANHMPPLRRENKGGRSCEKCGGVLTERKGTVLDPFAGSGTTGMAALAEGFNAVLIEREAEYVADINRRLAHVEGADTPLFAEVAE